VTVVAASDTGAGLPLALTTLNSILVGRVAQQASDLLGDTLASLGLRVRHYLVLMALAEGGPASQHVLGERLRIDRTTMVGAVDDLERLSLVVRKPSPADRRAYHVELTPRGRTTLVRATGAVAAAEDAFLRPLMPLERAQLQQLLARLVQNSSEGTSPPARRRGRRQALSREDSAAR
jgi:DNA-binding MarR family transcriptional regulator